MADRFFASYEDEFSPQPNSARGRSSVLPHGVADARRDIAGHVQRSEPNWPDQYVPDHYASDHYAPAPQMPKPQLTAPDRSADPYDHDVYDRDYALQRQPMFAPLDRRAAQGQSYPPQYDRGAYDRPDDVQDHMLAYERTQAPGNSAKSYPAYGQPERVFALQPDRIAKMTQWAGTFCSVLVLFGAVYWAYELAVRDARGIPVVRAAEGPLRIAPTIPGGEVSANQGLAVNAIAAKGGAEPLPDVVTLAPAPLQLAQDDVAGTASAEAPAAIEIAQVPANPETIPDQTGSDLADLAAKTPDVMPISDEAAVEAALAMALSEGAEPVTKSNTDAAQPAQLATLDAAPNVALEAPVTAPPTSEVDPASIPAGTKLVQLGAFDDDAAARAAWAVLQTQFTDLIGTKALVVQKATSGGRVFFRLRAHGFADEDETRRFCAALLAENASCIPVSQR